MTTLYVGNLPFSATDSEVRGPFEQHRTVKSVTIINGRDTGRARSPRSARATPPEGGVRW
jgi:RNA recognition motif-containing protein